MLPREYLGPIYPPVQKFLRHYKVQAMSWMEVPVGKYQAVEGSKTLSYNQAEVTLNHEDIIFHAPAGQWNESAPLRILSFDIETRVPADMTFTPYHNTAKMPVIQIGNIITSRGGPSYRCIFTLDGCAKIQGAKVLSFADENSMLLAWKQFMVESDPDLITGHNIARFDFVYLILRAEALGLSDFACLGRLKGVSARALRVSPRARRAWKDAPVLAGRLQIDIYQYMEERNIRNRFQGRSYKLNDLSNDFLGKQKEDLSFTIINQLQDGDDEDRKRLAVYCLKDVYLPLELLDCAKLKCLEEAIAAARGEKYIHLPFSDFLRTGRNC
ncbi:ribonuclease H-like domain-containing protein [Mycena vulgaris]|nr:ribonuclease H-like domain-containing protein [Mycena vulgaris]